MYDLLELLPRHLIVACGTLSLFLSGNPATAITVRDTQSPFSRFVADSPEDDARFGISVDISDTHVAVGALEHESDGAAYLFDLDGQQLHQLQSDNFNGRRFGLSVSLDGDFALVGAPGDIGVGSQSGAAFLFDVNTGLEVRKFVPPDLQPRSELGWSAALEGNLAVVGAPFHDFTNDGKETGAVFVFSTDTGEVLHRLVPEDPSRLKFFGHSVAIDGNNVLVGASRDGVFQGEQGAAYLFDLSTGEQTFKLQAKNPTNRSAFGKSVDLIGNLAVVGSPGTDDGSVHVFDIESGEEIEVLSEPGNEFGSTVAISNDFLVVGDPSGFGQGSVDGAAYVYDTSNWNLVTELISSSTDSLSLFGTSVAIHESGLAIVGAEDAGQDFSSVHGAAYAYAIVPEPSSYVLLVGGCVFALLLQRR